MEVELKDTLNQRWKNDKSGFGFRMLAKMGWKEETGLGKNEDGTVNALKVKKREENLGLGMDKVSDGAGNIEWSSSAQSFNDVLSLLKKSYGSGSSSSDKKKASRVKKSQSAKIVVGMKYKRMKEAKDLSTKSAQELRSILGVSPSQTGTEKQ